MAVNEERSMNDDLKEGITDGWIKKATPNRGGSTSDFGSSQSMYSDLHSELYDQAFRYANNMAERITAL